MRTTGAPNWIVFLALITTLIDGTESGLIWQTNPEGTVAYAWGCDFSKVINGYGFTETRATDAVDCWNQCLADSECTTFTWNTYMTGRHHYCYLKRGTMYRSQAVESPRQICGYLARSIFPEGDTKAEGCNWENRDIGREDNVNEDGCISKCAETDGCTHWTFHVAPNGYGVCFLKNGVVKPAEAYKVAQLFVHCGYVETGGEGCYKASCDPQ